MNTDLKGKGRPVLRGFLESAQTREENIPRVESIFGRCRRYLQCIFIMFFILYSISFLLSAAAVRAVPSQTTVVLPTIVAAKLLDRSLVSYSFEDRSMVPFSSTPMAFNIFSALAAKAGQPPVIRIGGGSADKTFYDPNASAAVTFVPPYANITLGPNYWTTFNNYFPAGTNFIFCLNLATSTVSTAVSLAQGAVTGLGTALKFFEIGNEVDHYPSQGQRPSGWNVVDYAHEWLNISSAIMTAVYKNSKSKTLPRFQAATFADTPNAITSNFDIPDLINQGGVKGSFVTSYAMHLYPMSRCSVARLSLANINDLSNHNLIYSNMSQYPSQISAANSVKADFVLGESGTASCSGIYGLSDSFAAGLWLVDWVLTGASFGMKRIYFHTGVGAAYSAFAPVGFSTAGQSCQPGVLPTAYAAYFVATAISYKAPLYVAPLPNPQSDFSAYGLYRSSTSSRSLQKLVFLNMAVYNSSVGVSNPASPPSTDSTSVTPGDRPQTTITVQTKWTAGSLLYVHRLQGPGSNAKSLVNVTGLTFDNNSGSIVTNETPEMLTVGAKGLVTVSLLAAEAIVVEKST